MSEVFWIEGDPRPGLAIVLCPRGDDWLANELRRVKKAGVDTLVSLLQPDEADMLGLGNESLIASENGLEFLSYPIPDGSIPRDTVAFRSFVEGLADRLRAGKRVGVHCRGSVGRAPLTAACTLTQLGWAASNTLIAIEAARGYPIPDTLEQEEWILRYEPRP